MLICKRLDAHKHSTVGCNNYFCDLRAKCLDETASEFVSIQMTFWLRIWQSGIGPSRPKRRNQCINSLTVNQASLIHTASRKADLRRALIN